MTTSEHQPTTASRARRTPLAWIPLAFVALLIAGVLMWRSQLVRLAGGNGPRPLVAIAADLRAPQSVDVVLPAAPVGMIHLKSGQVPLLIHYWAPWERHGRVQAASLDSLARLYRSTDLHVVLVCSDPFPSVARFVARQRLRLRVLLDGPGLMRAEVPCPRLPHTVFIDRSGRAAVVQSGEVDWFAPETRGTIERVLAEPAPADTVAPDRISA